MNQKTKGCECESSGKPAMVGCCSGVDAKDVNCCVPKKHLEKRLLIEFMFIDLTVCDWC